MYISPYLVGAFFGALITGFLTVAVLTWMSARIAKLKQEDDK